MTAKSLIYILVVAGLLFVAIGPVAAEEAAVLTLTSNSLSFTILPFDTEPPPGLLAGAVEGSSEIFQLRLQLADQEQMALLPVEEALQAYPDAPIPMEWALRWKGLGDWTSWEPGQTLDPVTLDWPIGGEASNCYEFELRCQLKPRPVQLAGDYNASVTITAASAYAGD